MRVGTRGIGRDIRRIADIIHSEGGLFGLVLNPETGVSCIEPYLDCLDTVTLMLVHPGYAGAKMVDGIMDKEAQLRKYLDLKGYEKVLISVDGSVSRDRAHHMAEMGAGIFVGGTAGIYRKDLDLPSSVREMRSAISVL